jgi:glycosyltransferase involved in cell wall biosynthesis
MVSTPRRVALKLAFSSKPEADITGAPDEALPGDLPALNIYHSSAVEGSLSEVLGAPNYSYRFAEAKFMAAFAAHGRTSIKLAMPEYYATEAALPPGMRSEGLPAAHLIFRSTEQIRLLKFAWNICCFAWEFDVLKDDTGINEHPFLNQKRMLSLCDEVWVPCSYTKAVLERHGIANVHVIPAPIETPARGRSVFLTALAEIGNLSIAPLHHNFLNSKQENAAYCAERSSTLGMHLTQHMKDHDAIKIYLTILNPEDSRKNLDAMLRAFDYFSKKVPSAVLLVKVLTSTTRFSLFEVLGDVVPHKLDSGSAFASKNIVFFNDFLSEAELHTLYGIADFYLCASLCEGQNLPLLEAMSHGVVPVTTANTAMQDYIGPDNALIIAGQSAPNSNPHLAGTIARKPFNIAMSRVEDIYEALLKSMDLTPARYGQLSSAARKVVQEKFSLDTVWSAMCARFSEIRRLVGTRDRRTG